MSVVLSCPSCASVLRVPDLARGRLVRCPTCREAVRVKTAEDAVPAEEAKQRFTERRPNGVPRRPAASEDVDRPARRRPRAEPPPEELEIVEEAPQELEVVEEVEAVDEPVVERPKKKKKRKKKRPRLPLPGEEEERETPAWIWWAAGCGGIGLTFLTLLVLLLVAKPGSDLQFYAISLLIKLPISTVIFFGAMILSNFIAEACDIGEIHIAIFKAFGLLLVVNIVSLLRNPSLNSLGGWITFPIWLIGVMVLFRLDFWEARILILFNWGLNFLIGIFLMSAIADWNRRAADHIGLDAGPASSREAPEKTGWDEHDIEDLGGKVELYPVSQDESVVIGISFRGAAITDADLAHLKDFSRLRKLDLTNTRITDAGLKHLADCKELRILIVTGTQVTDAGVEALRQALPRIQVTR